MTNRTMIKRWSWRLKRCTLGSISFKQSKGTLIIQLRIGISKWKWLFITWSDFLPQFSYTMYWKGVSRRKWALWSKPICWPLFEDYNNVRFLPEIAKSPGNRLPRTHVWLSIGQLYDEVYIIYKSGHSSFRKI